MRDGCVRDIVNKSVIHHASLKIQSSRFQQLTISKIEIVRDVRDFSKKRTHKKAKNSEIEHLF